MKKSECEIEEACAYCEFAAPLHDDDTVLCEKKGVVRACHKCRKFSYDPLKRKPASPKLPKLEYVNIDL